MDLTTVIGIAIGFLAMAGAIVIGGSFMIFIDIPSVLIVGFGLLGATITKWPMDKLKKIVPVILKSVFYKSMNAKDTIEEINRLAETARRESVFALEKVQIDDAFIKKAMTLAADNRPPDVISSILQMEIDSMSSRHKEGAKILDQMGADGPAFGMIGTLIGLVQMLQNLSDPSAIGPAMAVALLTTYYGAIIANVIAFPLKSKLETRSAEEVTKMEIVIVGTLGIVAGENPRLIKEKLSAYIEPSRREVIKDAASGGE